jgi:hypothetical protein
MLKPREVSRIEGFSDAVFGFAITLLVVSLEVPATFDDLLTTFKGLPVFAITFAMLLLVWQEHHTYFGKYALHDGVTIWLNGALLFVVMAYIYPLKFLFGFLAGPNGMSRGLAQQTMIRQGQMDDLMVVYGIGFVSMFSILAAMYWRSSRAGARIGLDAATTREARFGAGHCLVYVLVGVLSMAVSVLGGAGGPAFGGMTYMLIGPLQGVYHVWALRQSRGRDVEDVDTGLAG